MYSLGKENMKDTTQRNTMF